MENTEIDKPQDPGIDKPNTEVQKDNDVRNFGRGPGKMGRIAIPVLLVLVGVGLLLRQLGLGIPDWLVSWYTLLIVVGIFSGFAHAFRGPGWLIMILVGSFFLLDSVVPGFDLHRFLWPAVIITVGLAMLLRPKKVCMSDFGGGFRHRDIQKWQRRRRRRGYPGGIDFPGRQDFTGRQDALGSMESPGARMDSGSSSGPLNNTKSFSSEDYIDATTILGGIHKNILSKNFKGGDITIFMGGAELNLSQADIQGVASLDITQIMGGTKIIVPPNWEVRSNLTSVFGSVEDKRVNVSTTHTDKVLNIDGTSIFGGIEIRNY